MKVVFEKIVVYITIGLVFIALMFTSSSADPYMDKLNEIFDITILSHKNIKQDYAVLDYKATKASRFFGQATAGASALGSIDLGSTWTGEMEVGLGAGVSASYISTVYAGAVAVKYGITDYNSVTIKGWKSDGSSYSVGIGATHKFDW